MNRISPILFNTDMVQAILVGQKTETRRAVRYKYNNTVMYIKTDKYGTRLIEIQENIKGKTYGKNPDGSTWHKLRPYIEKEPPYRRGDILYVRETWTLEELYDGEALIRFKAGGEQHISYDVEGKLYQKLLKFAEKNWIPSIHMPKEAARIWLEVKNVRPEHLQDMDGQDILREGVNCHVHPEADYFDGNQKMMFAELWDSTIRKPELKRYGWDANPWVWAIQFKRCEKPEGGIQ